MKKNCIITHFKEFKQYISKTGASWLLLILIFIAIIFLLSVSIEGFKVTGIAGGIAITLMCLVLLALLLNSLDIILLFSTINNNKDEILEVDKTGILFIELKNSEREYRDKVFQTLLFIPTTPLISHFFKIQIPIKLMFLFLTLIVFIAVSILENCLSTILQLEKALNIKNSFSKSIIVFFITAVSKITNVIIFAIIIFLIIILINKKFPFI